ncbi:MAG: hypothetical protein ACRDZ5_04395 [Acidimicrobiales bacterium]
MAFAVSACSGYSGTSTAAKVHSWVAYNEFVANHDRLIDDISRATAAASHGSALQLRTVCAGMQFDIGTAYDTLPTPQESLTAALNTADQALFKAGANCARVASVHSARAKRALSQMAKAMQAFERVASLLRADGFIWRPTKSIARKG